MVVSYILGDAGFRSLAVPPRLLDSAWQLSGSSDLRKKAAEAVEPGPGHGMPGWWEGPISL